MFNHFEHIQGEWDPPLWEEEVSRQVSEMCRKGICRPLNSVWASGVVLIRRGDCCREALNVFKGLSSGRTDCPFFPEMDTAILCRGRC